jgi:hypothetical protein
MSPSICPYCKKAITVVAMRRTIEQFGQFRLQNASFEQGSVDEDEVLTESYECVECEHPITPEELLEL